MRRSPRLRRLESDWHAMQQLREASCLFDFSTPDPSIVGPPEVYLVRLAGRGLWKPDGSDRVLVREGHEILIRLGAAYPRMIPELVWRTPVFHPNISANGIVCLGGYSLYWAPSLQLDELCVLLWDIARYANFDLTSAYHRAAAQWARTQTQFSFPIDPRPLRSRVTCPSGPWGPGAKSADPDSTTANDAGPSGLVAAMGPHHGVGNAECVFLDERTEVEEIAAEGERKNGRAPNLDPGKR